MSCPHVGQLVLGAICFQPLDDVLEACWHRNHRPEGKHLREQVTGHQDCGLAGGTVYVTADGEMGCNLPHELEDGGVGETPAQPPTVVSEPEVLPSGG